MPIILQISRQKTYTVWFVLIIKPCPAIDCGVIKRVLVQTGNIGKDILWGGNGKVFRLL